MIFLGYSYLLIDKFNKFETVNEINTEEVMQTKKLHGNNVFQEKAQDYTK